MKKLCTLLFIIFTQIIIYITCIEPVIMTWNSSQKEINAKLVGDKIAPSIASTRAIEINASRQEVWNLLVLLGADRSGFYAYTFLEELLGYQTKKQNKSDKNLTLTLNRIIPTSIPRNTKYSFPVINVKQNEYFVLQGWGTFLLKNINENKTRFIIRTHSRNISSIRNKIFNPLHYIMERRMMLGLKAKAEHNNQNLVLYDIAYLFGILFSAIAILILIFTRKSILSISLAVIYSNIWLYLLLIFNPFAFYSLFLLFVVVTTNLLLKNKRVD